MALSPRKEMLGQSNQEKILTEEMEFKQQKALTKLRKKLKKKKQILQEDQGLTFFNSTLCLSFIKKENLTLDAMYV